ncbi:glycosyltransferase family 4 protein [Synechococcus sp. PCC 7336]|uniref:glycosyltransferase family 4 protein n=1 Tax=Synechococcus sp. PCC 7336 TaxID=195250 RepID=UPI00034D594E|nr:glycosyltransferase family 4 protein [Synechococcus sp. PCC 7336]
MPVSNSVQSTTTRGDRTATPDILVVTRTFLPKEGGIEEYVYNRCLQDPGRIVVLAASCPGDSEFDRQQPFSVHRWPMPAWLRSTGQFGSLLAQVFSMLGALLLGLLLFFRYRYRYIEWAHGFDFPSLLLLGYLLPVRYFVYLHGNDLLCPLRHAGLKLLFAHTLERASGLVCNSAFTSNYLRECAPVSTPTYVIHPIVRTDKFGPPLRDAELADLRQQIRGHYGIPSDAIAILSVGRLIPRKGFGSVVELLPQLLAAGIDVHYILCGRGSMEADLRSQVDRLELGDRVHFAGFVPDAELAGYYAASDIFAMLTFFETQAASIEGFGIVYREAGYFGKPVLASRVGGVADAVIHNETGFLVEPNDPEASVEALLHLCRSPELRQRLGDRGRELAQSTIPHSRLYESEGFD